KEVCQQSEERATRRALQLVDTGAGDAGSRHGLKPKCSFGCCSARLKSCPVTKRRREGGLSAVWRIGLLPMGRRPIHLASVLNTAPETPDRPCSRTGSHPSSQSSARSA